ncbi:MAG: response regulator [Planctomycetota bacterium]|nr:response regulator [Planctomycetota bacterium]
MVTSTRQEFQLLITDDNAAFRQVLREVLEDRPFLILHEAESGEEAVYIVQRQRIDIVLLDMHMHMMTGIETMRELKRMDFTRPCILITSDTSDDVQRDAREADAFSVLTKPVPRRELVKTVSDALVTAYNAFDVKPLC